MSFTIDMFLKVKQMCDESQAIHDHDKVLYVAQRHYEDEKVMDAYRKMFPGMAILPVTPFTEDI